MPVEFLTDDEAAAYGQYAGPLSQADLERDRRRVRGQPRPQPERRPCMVCGKLTANVLGVCAMTPECKRVHNHLFWCSVFPERQLPPCAVCGCPTSAALGVCQATAECRQELSRRWLAVKPESGRGRERAYARKRYAADPQARRDEAAQYRRAPIETAQVRTVPGHRPTLANHCP
jgi:hypothetical protein